MFNINKHLLLLLLLLILSACGGESDSIITEQPVLIATSTVNGSVTKGTLVGATIDAYNIAIDGTVDYTTLVASAITDTSGLFSLDLPEERGFLLLQSSGGDFIDETDQNPDINLKRKITFLSNEGLTIVLPPTYTSIALTMISQSIYNKTVREFNNDFYAVYQANINRYTSGFGFNPLIILPADPVNPDQSADEVVRQYALITGGLANIVNQSAIYLGFAQSTYEVIQAIISDFSDGNVDGTINGTPVSVANGLLPSELDLDLDLDTAIIRFRNNNFANFQTTNLPVINYDLLNNILPTANAGTDQTVAEGE
ncbi:MAG: hypothetical protein GY829_04805, partial [Gammaproteobacteria bacterium]|nr:hypothetical protein [Gammaproteobacteria bacterium]